MAREIITLEDIECLELKENILHCEKEILKFMKILRNHVALRTPSYQAELVKHWADEDVRYAFKEERMLKQIQRSDNGLSFGLFGSSLGYHVVWAFDLLGRPIESKSLYDFESKWYKNVIYFVYRQGETLPDHQINKSRFFSVFVAGMDYRENGTCEEFHKRLAHNNDNYPLTSILNPKVATRAVIEIKRILDEYFLFEEMKHEFETYDE